jgi:hypothetical protein
MEENLFIQRLSLVRRGLEYATELFAQAGVLERFTTKDYPDHPRSKSLESNIGSCIDYAASPCKDMVT